MQCIGRKHVLHLLELDFVLLQDHWMLWGALPPHRQSPTPVLMLTSTSVQNTLFLSALSTLIP